MWAKLNKSDSDQQSLNNCHNSNHAKQSHRVNYKFVSAKKGGNQKKTDERGRDSKIYPFQINFPTPFSIKKKTKI